MTDDELVEKMAIARHEHRRRLSPLVVSFGWYDLDPADQAAMIAEDRAALAVAEPVIRERCARIALYYPTPVNAGPHEAHGRDASAVGIASAIRATVELSAEKEPQG